MFSGDSKTGLIPAFALTIALVVGIPFTLDSSPGPNAAIAAGNGNGNGNGVGKGLETAPGQQDSADVAEGLSTDDELAPRGGELADNLLLLPIDEQAANNKVVRELAGLDEESALSEEEELEAIRSGWGTWRTADGPETVTAQ